MAISTDHIEIRVVAYTKEEGDVWEIPESHIGIRVSKYEPAKQLAQFLKNSNIHAIKTPEGRIFDVVNGWRKEEPKPDQGTQTAAKERSQEEAESLAGKLIDAWVISHGSKISWQGALKICLIVKAIDQKQFDELSKTE